MNHLVLSATGWRPLLGHWPFGVQCPTSSVDITRQWPSFLNCHRTILPVTETIKNIVSFHRDQTKAEQCWHYWDQYSNPERPYEISDHTGPVILQARSLSSSTGSFTLNWTLLWFFGYIGHDEEFTFLTALQLILVFLHITCFKSIPNMFVVKLWITILSSIYLGHCTRNTSNRLHLLLALTLSWPDFQKYIDGQGRADLPYQR